MESAKSKTPSFTIQFLENVSTPENPIWENKIQCFEEDAYIQPRNPIEFMNEYIDNKVQNAE